MLPSTTMIHPIDLWISALFVVVTVATLLLLFWATRSKALLIGVSIWAIVQASLGISGFYNDTTSLPPRVFAAGVLPAVLTIRGAPTFFFVLFRCSFAARKRIRYTLLAAGYFTSSAFSLSTITSATTARVNHLWSLDTIYHGACACERT